MIALGLAPIIGCQSGRTPAGTQVAQAWTRKAVAPPAKPAPSVVSPPADSGAPLPATIGADSDGAVIAYVNDEPVARSEVVDLLLAGHGVGLLEQVIVLKRAQRMAADQGLVVTPSDLDAERDQSLRALLSPLESADETIPFNREEAEQVLSEVLARRNVSRAECESVFKRNAYLRAIVRANMTLTEPQLAEEYARLVAPKLEIRHIQLANLNEAERVLDLLEQGSPFDALAREYSANMRTGPAGGRLRPFSESDPAIPEGLRKAAFRLEIGATSNPIHVDDWYHIIRVEGRSSPESRSFSEVRPELEHRLRDRLTEPAMQTLYRALFEQAQVRVEDPILAAEFERKHPGRSGTK